MKKVAVIGCGVSGLVSAWLLDQEYDVTVYEKNDYVGGHANTRTASFGETKVQADTGFMVLNNKTYPNLLKMFAHLGVETVKTDMAFGISVEHGAFEFSSDNPFVQRGNIIKPAYWKMLFDIVRFNRDAVRIADAHATEFPLRELLEELSLGEQFQQRFLLPMAGAIWSTDKTNILDYPAKQLVAFFDNHGLLSPKTLNPLKLNEGRLTWYTVQNGSQVYVQKILEQFRGEVRLSRGVTLVTRDEYGVCVEDEQGDRTHYDEIVFASHPDQTLRMLEQPTADERTILGAFVYTKNDTYLHRDPSYMLTKTKKWPSWTYAEPTKGAVELSYYMNRLQAIPTELPVFVTLNPEQVPSSEDMFYHTEYEHPRFTLETKAAQESLDTIQGQQHTWFAGAWTAHGFHEDGLRSALRVARDLHAHIPWE